MIRKLALYGCGISALLLYGCSGGVEQKPAVQQSAAVVPLPPALSINAEMVSLVDHSAHELWNLEKEGSGPKTDQEWEEVEHHAMQLVAAGSLITLGGTGPSDAGWVQSPDWKVHAQKLVDTATKEVNAARDKNLDALVKANGDLVEVCEGCHKQFKPPLPTEGIVHPHYRK